MIGRRKGLGSLGSKAVIMIMAMGMAVGAAWADYQPAPAVANVIDLSRIGFKTDAGVKFNDYTASLNDGSNTVVKDGSELISIDTLSSVSGVLQTEVRWLRINLDNNYGNTGDYVIIGTPAIRVDSMDIIGDASGDVYWRANLTSPLRGRSRTGLASAPDLEQSPLLRVDITGDFVVETGKIEAASGTALHVVGADNFQIGVVQTPGINSISIVSSDSGYAVLSDVDVNVNAPSAGHYDIRATRTGGDSLSVGIYAKNGSDVFITGTNGTCTTGVAGVAAAVVSEDGTVGIIGRNKVTLVSRAPNVVEAEGDVTIKDTKLIVTGSAVGKDKNTKDYAVISSASSDEKAVSLTNVSVVGPNNTVGGKLIETLEGGVWIEGGTFAMAKYAAIVAKKHVKIFGAVVSSDLATGAVVEAGYDNTAGQNVILTATNRVAGIIAMNGSAVDVVGIRATGNVEVTSAVDSAVVQVRSGKGTAIEVENGDVKVIGSVLKVASVFSDVGKAIHVWKATVSKYVTLIDARVIGAKFASPEGLIEVNADAGNIPCYACIGERFGGTNISAPTAGAVIVRITQDVEDNDGDWVYIAGGTIRSKSNAIVARNVHLGLNTTFTARCGIDLPILTRTIIEADTVAIKATDEVISDNNKAIVAVPWTGSSSIVNTAIKATIVTINTIDSVVARGVGTAIDNTENSEGIAGSMAITVKKGVIKSNTGTAIYSFDNVTLGGNAGDNCLITTDATVSGSSTLATKYAVHLEGDNARSAVVTVGTGATVSAPRPNGVAVRVVAGDADVKNYGVEANGGRIIAEQGTAISAIAGAYVLVNGAAVENNSTSFPVISVENGEFCKKWSGEAVKVTDGSVTAKATSGTAVGILIVYRNDVLFSSLGGGDVLVSGGEVSVTTGTGIKTTNGSNVTVTGGEVSATTGVAIETAIPAPSQTQTVANVSGDVKVAGGNTDATKVSVTTGIAIRTYGGNVTVKSNSTTGKGAVVTATTSGTGIRTHLSNEPLGKKAGVVSIGKDETNPDYVTDSVFSASGTGIRAEGQVHIEKLGRVTTYTGTGINADTVYLYGHDEDVRSQVIVTGGVGSTANTVGITGVKLLEIAGGKVSAGTAHEIVLDSAQYTATAISLTGSIASGITNYADSAFVYIGGNVTLVEALGAGKGIVSINPRSVIEVIGNDNDIDETMVMAQNSGIAIESVGRIVITEGVVKTGKGPNARAIKATGGTAGARQVVIVGEGLVAGGGGLAIGKGVRVEADTAATAIESGANVIDSIRAGSVIGYQRGRAISAAGHVAMTHEQALVVLIAADDSSAAGTAINAPSVSITDGRILSNAVAIASTGQVKVGRKFANSVGSEDPIYISGILDAAVEVTGALENQQGQVHPSVTTVLSAGSGYGTIAATKGAINFDVVKLTVAANRALTFTNTAVFAPKVEDTVWINGVLHTGTINNYAKFRNNAWTVISETGEVVFNNDTASGDATRRLNAINSFFNDDKGVMVLKRGSKLRSGASGVSVTLNNAAIFKLWADTLTFGFRATGNARVIVPPFFCDTTSPWGSAASVTDTVYRVPSDTGHVFVMDKRFNDYGSDEYRAPRRGNELWFSFASGTLPVGYRVSSGSSVLDSATKVDSAGFIKAVFSKADTYRFTIRATNQAGSTEKNYTIVVRTTNPVPAGTPGVTTHFSGVVTEPWIIGEAASSQDRKEYLAKNKHVSVYYTGAPVSVAFRADSLRIGGLEARALFTGFGDPKFFYEGTGTTAYPRDERAPTNAGTYKVWTTFGPGGINFNTVTANSPGDTLELGELEILASPLAYLLGQNVREGVLDVIRVIDLPCSTAVNAEVSLPDVKKYLAKYDDLNITGIGNASLIEGDAQVNPNISMFLFSTTEESRHGNTYSFRIPIIGDSRKNVETGSNVTVVVYFKNAAGMMELRPVIVIDYRNELLTGFEVGREYKLGNAGLGYLDINDSGNDIPIPEEWIGQMLEAVALGSTVHKTPSQPFLFRIPPRPEAPTLLPHPTTSVTATDGSISIIGGPTSGLEYRKDGQTTWTPVSGTVITHLGVGDYHVRTRALTNVFSGEIGTVTVLPNIKVDEPTRDIPRKTEEVTAITPTKALKAQFTAGPNPVAKSAGQVAFYWQGKALSKGTVSVYNAAGTLVKKVNVADKAVGNSDRREIGSWNLTDAKGRRVAEGTYLVKCTLVAKDGTKEKVSYIVGVR